MAKTKKAAPMGLPTETVLPATVVVTDESAAAPIAGKDRHYETVHIKPEDVVDTAPAVGNKYGVGEPIWGQWTDAQRAMYDGLYRLMFDNQRLFKHAKAPTLPDEQWRAVARAAAFHAADLLTKD